MTGWLPLQAPHRATAPYTTQSSALRARIASSYNRALSSTTRIASEPDRCGDGRG
jgi:hypothetical protein